MQKIQKQKHIVKFHNDLNSLELQGYTESNINILMTLCHTMAEQGTNEITITLDTLRRILNYNKKGISFTKKRLETFAKEMQRVRLQVENNNCTIFGVLFHKIKVNNEEKTVTIKTDKDFLYIINNLVENYTIFDLQDLIGMKGIYSKLIFKLLKQYKETGVFVIDIGMFRRLLSVPESYKMPQITERIINPALKELKPFFKDLEVEKIKKSGHGNIITHIKFTWIKEEKKENQFIKIENEEILDIFEKSQTENIEYLQEVMSEYTRQDIVEFLQLADVATIIQVYERTNKYIKEHKGKNLYKASYLKRSIINYVEEMERANTKPNNRSIKNKNISTSKSEKGKQPTPKEEMDELERKLQERLFRRIGERVEGEGA